MRVWKPKLKVDPRNMVETPEEGYKCLAAYVVKYAIMDYQQALRLKDASAIDTLEKWFRGPVFALYCDADPEYIIEQSRRSCGRKRNA